MSEKKKPKGAPFARHKPKEPEVEEPPVIGVPNVEAPPVPEVPEAPVEAGRVVYPDDAQSLPARLQGKPEKIVGWSTGPDIEGTPLTHLVAERHTTPPVIKPQATVAAVIPKPPTPEASVPAVRDAQQLEDGDAGLWEHATPKKKKPVIVGQRREA